jgi:hypothetical protein
LSLHEGLRVRWRDAYTVIRGACSSCIHFGKQVGLETHRRPRGPWASLIFMKPGSRARLTDRCRCVSPQVESYSVDACSGLVGVQVLDVATGCRSVHPGFHLLVAADGRCQTRHTPHLYTV